MSRTRSRSPVGRQAAGQDGFTYVEVTISLGLLVVVMGAFVIALEGGSNGLATGAARGMLSARAGEALAAMDADLREAAAAKITTEQTGLPANQCAVVLPCARDSSGAFVVNGAYRPAWQAVVVYCPHVSSKGVSQLRRYVYFDPTYTFPFQVLEITADTIRLRDAGGQTLDVDRESGNPALPAGREFQVLCPGLTELAVEVGAPTRLSIQASCMTRRNVSLDIEAERYVAHRN